MHRTGQASVYNAKSKRTGRPDHITDQSEVILGQSYDTQLTEICTILHHTRLHQTTKYTKATHNLRPSLRRLLDLHLAV